MILSGRSSLNASWKSLCREAGLRYIEDCIQVRVGENRFQKVFVDERQAGVIRLWSRIALRSQLRPDRDGMESPELRCWSINRYRELVGFKVSDRGTIIGESWIPMIEILPEEWRLYVETLAFSSDRLEHLWTGTDRE